MKKLVLIISILLIVASISQVTFAKGSVSVRAGYEGFPLGILFNAFNCGVSADFYVTDNFSLMGAFNLSIIPEIGNLYYANLFTRYDLLRNDSIRVGVQFGWISNIPSRKLVDTIFNFIGPGVYMDLKVAPKFNIHADIRLPMASFVFYSSSIPFIFYYYFDMSFGATYSVNSNIDVGLDIAGTNCNYLMRSQQAVDFSICAKATYKF